MFSQSVSLDPSGKSMDEDSRHRHCFLFVILLVGSFLIHSKKGDARALGRGGVSSLGPFRKGKVNGAPGGRGCKMPTTRQSLLVAKDSQLW